MEEYIEDEVEYKPVEIYHFDRKTKEYLGSETAQADPEESRVQGKFVPLLSAFSTLMQPPEFEENQIPVYHSHFEEQTVTKQVPIYDDETGEITTYEEQNETVKVLIENWTIEKDLRKNFYTVDENLNVNEITVIGEVEGLIVSKELGEQIKENPENYKIENNEVVKKSDEEIAAEKEQKERERISMLSLTAADVERALYKSRKIDFEDVVNLVKDNSEVDIKALKIELKANNFYRGNPYIEQIGTLLGYTSKDMDYLFENKELPAKAHEAEADQAKDLTPSVIIKKKSSTTEKYSDVIEKE